MEVFLPIAQVFVNPVEILLLSAAFNWVIGSLDDGFFDVIDFNFFHKGS